MQKFQDVVQDTYGNALAGVSVTVYDAGTTNPASIFESDGTTPLTNPVTTDAEGLFWFYAAAGEYDLSPSLTGYTGDDLDGVVVGVALDEVQSWTAAQRGAVTALTSTDNSIAINLALTNNFAHTLTEDTTLAAPTNAVAGQSGIIVFTQGNPARLLAFNSAWKFVDSDPTISTSTSSVSTMAYYVVSASVILCSFAGPYV